MPQQHVFDMDRYTDSFVPRCVGSNWICTKLQQYAGPFTNCQIDFSTNYPAIWRYNYNYCYSLWKNCSEILFLILKSPLLFSGHQNETAFFWRGWFWNIGPGTITLLRLFVHLALCPAPHRGGTYQGEAMCNLGTRLWSLKPYFLKILVWIDTGVLHVYMYT